MVDPVSVLEQADRAAVALRGRLRSLTPLSAVLLSCAAETGCQGPILDPQGPIGLADRTILLNSLTVMLCIVVPTILATLTFGWWFRSSNKAARYRPSFTYSGRLEILVWTIPLLTIAFLGGIAWVGSHELDPSAPIASSGKPLEVEVISLDWKWLFIYPQLGIASVNELPLPVGVPVHFRLTSASVMNAFFVPRLGSMIYVMNGMETQLSLRADRPGRYPGLSSHFSGDGFSDMHFDAVAMPPAQFASWIAAARNHGPELDDGAYRTLEKQSEKVAPFTYGAVRQNLFQDVAMQRLAPAAGPQKGFPSADVSPRLEKK